MRVICIQKDTTTVHGPDTPGKLIEGEAYTVTGVEKFMGKDYYTLSEFSPLHSFWVELFIPCSDIDETELEYNAEKQTA